MKKLFCCSDIHSFFTEWMKALKRKKFDINNPDHILIICGDIFDRGPDSNRVYDFIRSVPKNRRILIRGNHESLLRELVHKGYAENHDYHNGTYDTLFQLADIGFKDDAEMTHEYYKELDRKQLSYGDSEYEDVRIKYRNLRSKLYQGKVNEILDWIASDEWVNYFELDNYIFVHSWIPVAINIDWEKTKLLQVPVKSGPDTFREDWRNATQQEWEDAMWGCPWKKAIMGLNKTGKTIVCGHWHTSDFFNYLTMQTKSIYNCPIFKSKKYKLIGLDACTAGSGKVNVLTLEISDEEWSRWYVDNYK